MPITCDVLRKRGSVLAVLFLMAASAYAAISRPYEEWRKGPVGFLFTSEEEKAWKRVATDQEASDFIDLFWARRDPTPRTPQNEYLEEHERRVAFADQQFLEKGRRGAMTERGRVLVMIGAPANMNLEVSKNAQQSGGDDTLTGGHDLGRKDVWMWSREEAKQFGMPKVEVVFITDPVTRRVSRDPGRGDFLGAAKAAMKTSMVSPELKSLPGWALVGGLNPQVPSALQQSTSSAVEETSVIPIIAPVASAVVPGAPVNPEFAAMTAGASRLTLLKDVFSITTETSVDPFTHLQPVAAFKVDEDLGWVAQFCSPVPEVPVLRFTLRLTGMAGTQSINRAADPDEMMPDKLKAVPGCYMLRGVVPLAGMGAGSYQLQVQIDDPATARSYTVQQAFRIE